MPEPHEAHPGPFPSLILGAPLAPARMTQDQAIGLVIENYGYPLDMPHSIWRAEYGGFEHWYPRPDEPPGIKPLRTTDIWKVTATGERLVDYFIPGPDRDSVPPPTLVWAVLIDDKEGGIFEARSYWAD